MQQIAYQKSIYSAENFCHYSLLCGNIVWKSRRNISFQRIDIFNRLSSYNYSMHNMSVCNNGDSVFGWVRDVTTAISAFHAQKKKQTYAPTELNIFAFFGWQTQHFANASVPWMCNEIMIFIGYANTFSRRFGVPVWLYHFLLHCFGATNEWRETDSRFALSSCVWCVLHQHLLRLSGIVSSYISSVSLHSSHLLLSQGPRLALSLLYYYMVSYEDKYKKNGTPFRRKQCMAMAHNKYCIIYKVA